jgi:transcriptional regulator with XRE-family HTH domain
MPIPHPSPLTEHARQLIEGLMENERLSARQVAARSSTDHSTVSRMIRGEGSPTLVTLEQIMAGLGYEVVLDIRPL